jgi:hypothetical protein
MIHLGNHPEVMLCVRCGHWAAKQAWEIEDRAKTGPLVRARDRFRSLRRSVIQRGWQHNRIVGGPLRWIGKRLPQAAHDYRQYNAHDGGVTVRWVCPAFPPGLVDPQRGYQPSQPGRWTPTARRSLGWAVEDDLGRRSGIPRHRPRSSARGTGRAE